MGIGANISVREKRFFIGMDELDRIFNGNDVFALFFVDLV